MDILFLSNTIPWPVRNGNTQRTYNILKQLGHRNNVYLLSFYQSPPEINPPVLAHLQKICTKIAYCRSPSKQLSIEMIQRLFWSLLSKKPYMLWRHLSEEYAKKLQGIIRNNRFDLVHIDMLPLAQYRKYIGNLKCSLTFHDISFIKFRRIANNHKNFAARFFLLLESRKLKSYETSVCRDFDVNIAVSDLDAKILSELGGEIRFEIIPNGVDTEMYRPANAVSSKKSILWVGGMSYFPNRDAVFYFLQEIYPILREKEPGIEVIIVGGDVPESFQKFAQVNKNISFPGFVNDIAPFFEQAQIFFAPIRCGGGTRLKIIEAMAAGKASVTTSIGCEGIAGVNRVHYIIADSPREFAGAILELLHNDSLRNRIAYNAGKLAEKIYDYNMLGGKLHSIYEEMCKPG